jgi:hypothetical protein
MDRIENKSIIKVRRDSNCYTAIFVNGAPRIEAIAAFGTNELPTAFTEKACWSDVIKAIRKKNPDCIVLIDN